MTRIAIIGAGPAGCAAAIQLKRSGYEPTLFEAYKIGGLIRNAYLIENYMGFPNGLSGDKFSILLEKHIERFNISTKFQKIEYVDFIDNEFILSNDDHEFTADFCIVATGTKPKKLPQVVSDNEYDDKIFYEIAEIREKINNCEIAIIGGGDAAFDYALSLSSRNKVDILMRSSEPKALKYLINYCSKVNNISLFKNIQLINIFRKNEKLLLNCNTNCNDLSLYYDYLIVAIGREKNLPSISDRAKNSGKLFLIGDVAIDDNRRQASIAAGMGINIAMKIDQLTRSGQ